MTEETTDDDRDGAGPVCGERLRAGRRANDISVGDVAKELHLDEAKVRALERNDFEVLGAPVFAKGHLRKYAEMVGVAEADVMADYYQLTRAQGIPPVVGPVRKRRRDIDVTPWIVGILSALAVSAALYWWLVLRTPQPSPLPAAARPAVSAPAPRPSDSRQAESRPAADSRTGDGGNEATAAEPQPDESAPTVPEPEPAARQQVRTAIETAPTAVAAESPPPDDGRPRLAVGLAYGADCWTEVSDATGRRLFYDLAAAGRSLTLSGVPPIRIIVGDADAVSVTVDGAPFTIPRAARNGRLARFTINAPE